MTTYLIGLGHRRIAFLCGNSILSSTHLREEGYRSALVHAGIQHDDHLVVPGAYWRKSGFDVAMRLLQQPLQTLPTAIFCAGDSIAFGVLDALKESGVNAPQDISVAGFDNTLGASDTQPPLTTVLHPQFAIGRRAAEILLDQIEGRAAPGTKELLAPELVIRRSTGAPRCS